MSEDSTTISTLEYGCSGGALQVRILRTWTPQIRSYETWFLAVDKHGDTIQILGQKKDQGHIKSILTISNCYTISDYACAEPDEYQNCIGKEIYISVGNASSICRIPDTRIIPTTSFRFISKIQIPDYVKQDPDFLGVFVKFRELTTKNKEPYTLLILTTESDEEIAIGLWKECTNVVEKFDRNLIEATPAPTVLAVTNAKIMTVAGALKVGTTSASHVYINPSIPETAALLDRFMRNCTSRSACKGPPTPLYDINEKPYSELLDKTFTVKASAVNITFTNNWYQVLCPLCKTSSFKKGNDWFCTSDGMVTTPIFMYKLSTTLTDTTDSITTNLSNNTVEKLTSITSEKAIQQYGHTHRKTLPPFIQNCKGLQKKMGITNDQKLECGQHSLHNN
ncbi:unnamed protein product [Lactuca virosa]|uniref:Replication factor A C-terminal domain-containing protein n=1 Tax=Lactuca virosa TaxID=75947 RepID=A0AAU9MEV0_9ASTR|nr:unnamed protein product [Lactuca virosa]